MKESGLDERPVVPTAFTYVIDYADHLGIVDEFIASMNTAPPHMVHVGSLDTPIINGWGTTMPLEGGTDKLMDVEEIEERIVLNRRITDGAHEAGVRWIIPYICNQTLGGNIETRTGIWNFYDHWDDYTSLGIGPKPEADPVDWMARDRDGGFHYNYETLHTYFLKWDQHRYAPCVNNPYYNQYQRAVVLLIARSGYDGTFIDNCILNCFCDHCQAGFRNYIGKKFTDADREEALGWSSELQITLEHRGGRIEYLKDEPLFRDFLTETLSPEVRVRWLGTDDMSKARVQDGGNGWLWSLTRKFQGWCRNRLPENRWPESLDTWGIRDRFDRVRWAETKRFWAESIKTNLENIRSWGLEEREEFTILPNWGAMRGVDGHKFRDNIGHDFNTWAPASEWQMWEEDGDPGMLAEGVYVELTLPYRFALAHGASSGAISANPANKVCSLLAFAEAGAHGAAYIQPGWQHPDQRGDWTKWLDSRNQSQAGMRSAAEVGIAYSAHAVHMEDMPHLPELLKVTRWLSDSQIPFDYLIDGDLNIARLSGYEVIVLPGLTYFSDDELTALEEYLNRGGIVVLIGDTDTADGWARERKSSALSECLARRQPRNDGIATNTLGDGLLIHLPDTSVLSASGGPLSLDEVWDLGRADLEPLQVGSAPINRYHLMTAADDSIGIERYIQPSALSGLLRARLGRELSVADPVAASGLRVWPYVKLDDDRPLLTVHLLNYRPLLTEEAANRQADPLKNLEISVRLPEGWKAVAAAISAPGEEGSSLNFVSQPSSIGFVVGELTTYAAVDVELGRG